jgi:hypothetical protein
MIIFPPSGLVSKKMVEDNSSYLREYRKVSFFEWITYVPVIIISTESKALLYKIADHVLGSDLVLPLFNVSFILDFMLVHRPLDCLNWIGVDVCAHLSNA